MWRCKGKASSFFFFFFCSAIKIQITGIDNITNGDINETVTIKLWPKAVVTGTDGGFYMIIDPGEAGSGKPNSIRRQQ